MPVNAKKKIVSSPSNQLEPLLNIPDKVSSNNINTSTTVSVAQPTVAKPKVAVTRKANQIGTPSIRKALAGNNDEEDTLEITDKQVNVNSEVYDDKSFTIDDVHKIWPQIAGRYVDQKHLYNTLLTLPSLDDDKNVVITVENSVQQDKIRLLKPELIGALRRKLNNSTIDVNVDLNRTQNEHKILTDEQRLKAMIERNPALGLFKNKFNLDFNG